MSTQPGMSAAWREYALKLRGILSDLGADLVPCLPDDPEPCGMDYFHHCLSYSAALQARAEYGLQHLHHGDRDIVAAANGLIEYWRNEFAKGGGH